MYSNFGNSAALSLSRVSPPLHKGGGDGGGVSTSPFPALLRLRCSDTSCDFIEGDVSKPRLRRLSLNQPSEIRGVPLERGVGNPVDASGEGIAGSGVRGVDGVVAICLRRLLRRASINTPLTSVRERRE
jgi:hypothetical protein